MIWILSILGVDVTAALAGVGIVALVLSFGAQRLLNREIKLALDEGGIEIPFPQVVVHQA